MLNGFMFLAWVAEFWWLVISGSHLIILILCLQKPPWEIPKLKELAYEKYPIIKQALNTIWRPVTKEAHRT